MKYASVLAFVLFAACTMPVTDDVAGAVLPDAGTFEPGQVVAVGVGPQPEFEVGTVGSAPLDLFHDGEPPVVGAISASEVLYVGHHLEVVVPVSDNIDVTRCELWLDDTSWSMVVTDGEAIRSHFLADDGHYLARVACGDVAGNVGVGPEVTLIVSQPTHPCRLFVERDETRLPTGRLDPLEGEELFLGALVVRTQCATTLRYVTLYDWDRELASYGAHVVVRDGDGTALTREVVEPFAGSHAEQMDFLYETPLAGDVPMWLGIYIQLHVLPGHGRVSVRPLWASAAVEAEDEAVLVAGAELPSEIIVYPSE